MTAAEERNPAPQENDMNAPDTPTADESRALLAGLTGYTPKPWRAFGEHHVRTESGKAIAEMRLASARGGGNARLIAAAPDLVDHLRAALDREAALMAERDAARADVERLRDGNRPLPFDREALGRMVREAWVRWAQTQTSPKPSWLVPYDELSEADKEADRQIGETIARWTLVGDAARAALAAWDASREGGR